MICAHKSMSFKCLVVLVCQLALTSNAIAKVTSWSCSGKDFKTIVTIDSSDQGSSQLVFSKNGKSLPVEVSGLEQSEWANGEVYLSFDFVGPESWSDGAKKNFGFGEFMFNRSTDAYELVMRRFDDSSGEMEWGPFSKVTCKK